MLWQQGSSSSWDLSPIPHFIQQILWEQLHLSVLESQLQTYQDQDQTWNRMLVKIEQKFKARKFKPYLISSSPNISPRNALTLHNNHASSRLAVVKRISLLSKELPVRWYLFPSIICFTSLQACSPSTIPNLLHVALQSTNPSKLCKAKNIFHAIHVTSSLGHQEWKVFLDKWLRKQSYSASAEIPTKRYQ